MTSGSFKDLFSLQASQYSRFRPTYPEALFKFVASLPQTHDRLWDCGTGNGQAAVGLAPYFKEVVATDPSQEQIKHATPCPNVKYLVSTAESSPLEAKSVDLITAAAAAHWFQFERFYEEVRRVLKPGGWLALWTYGHNRTLDPKFDSVLNDFELKVVGPYWAQEIQLVRDEYKTIPFPFEEIQTPQLTIERSFNLFELLGYISSWSATQKYLQKNKKDPLIDLQSQLAPIWGSVETSYKMKWPIYFRVGRLPK